MKRAIRWASLFFLAAIMTTVLPPAWGATPAASAAPAQTVHAGYLENVTFESLPGKERVTWAVSKQPVVTIENQPGNSVVVRMENLFVPEELRGPLSNTALANVFQVTPVQKSTEGRSWVLATIDMKQKVPFSVRQEGRNILIDFNVTTLAAAGHGDTLRQDVPVLPLPVVQVPAAASPSAEKSATREGKSAREAAGNAGQETKVAGAPRILLDVQDADIKAVLRLLSEQGNVSIVSGDDVKGTLTLKIKDVSWEQALDTILRINGLQKIEKGNVIMVMNRDNFLKLKNDEEEQAKRKQMELDTEPLITRVVPIRYRMLKFVEKSKIEVKGELRASARESAAGPGSSKGSTAGGTASSEGKAAQQNKDFAGAASGKSTRAEKVSLEGVGDFFALLQSFLTPDAEGNARGWIGADADTNSVIITAVKRDLDKILDMIAKTDIPTDQILIKANVVETTKSTARNLGIRWGNSKWGQQVDNRDLSITPGVNFGAAAILGAGPATLGLTYGSALGNLLDLQLSAMQKDGKLNILSSPSLITLDNQMASTENGEEIPYVTPATSTAPATVTWKKAVLRLEITPHVIDGNNIKMTIVVKKDEPNYLRETPGGYPIVVKETKTDLVVADGETIVISGFTKQRKDNTVDGVPWFKDVPVLGWLFKGEAKSESMEEVLIFITPNILKPPTVIGIQEGA